MTPARAVYAVAVATILGLVTVQQSLLIRHTGYRIEDLRGRLAEQRVEEAVYHAHLGKLRSPQRVLGLVAYLGLDLQPRTVVEAAAPAGADAGALPPSPTVITLLDRPDPAGAEGPDMPEGVSVAARF